MAKELFNSDFYTLPEQVQINKEDIETNTTDIAKLKDDISKIKPNAWEKNTSIMEGGNKFEQYIPADFNSDIPYSFVKYNIDTNGNPTSQNIGLMAGKLIDSTGIGNAFLQLILSDSSYIDINETYISFHFGSDASTVDMKYENDEAILFLDKTSLQFNKGEFINEFTNNDNHDYHQVLTAFATNQYYLKKSDASNTYLSKTEASNTYVTKQDYDERYDTGDISLTQAGYNKINSMDENIGSTITLTATSDFTENTQVSNTRELILSVNYNANPIYRNIHLMPNQTIDDYTAYQDATEENWYTGHAILVLPSQDNGYFAITYQNGTHSQLILTLIAHY